MDKSMENLRKCCEMCERCCEKCYFCCHFVTSFCIEIELMVCVFKATKFSLQRASEGSNSTTNQHASRKVSGTWVMWMHQIASVS